MSNRTRPYFSDWVKPYEEACKGRCKLTNKNKHRLNEIYISWFVDTYGEELGPLNAMFHAVYAENVATLVPNSNSFLERVRPERVWDSVVMEWPVIFGDRE